MKCPTKKCEKQEPFPIDISLNKISIKNIQNFVKDITVVSNKLEYPLIFSLRTPSFKSIIDDRKNKKTVGESTKDLIINSIHSISYGEELKYKKEFNAEELDNFVELIPRKYYKEFDDFFEKSPELVYEEQVVCSKCKSNIIIEVSDFFHLCL
jgi:hypothetical protein